MTMKAALYARVSTKDQDASLQVRELTDFIARRGWILESRFIDTGVSGARERRPELDRLMAAALRRDIDIVVVWKLDRFGRSLRHLVNTLAQLQALGVAFVSMTDQLDLSTPHGMLMFQIIGAMSEFERALIRERVRAGIAHARARGVQLGRRARVVNVDYVLSRLRQGTSWAAISREDGVGVATLYRALRRAGKAIPKTCSKKHRQKGRK